MKNNNVSHSSPNSSEIYYEVHNDTLAGNRVPLGTQDTRQSSLNTYQPNVQAAIDDLKGSFLPLNTLIYNSDGENPQGASQVDFIDFSGTVEGTGPTIVQVFGLPVTVNGGDTASEVTAAFEKLAQDLVSKNQYFSFVQKETETRLTIKYIDYRDHDAINMYSNGINVSTELQSPAKYGYGTWVKLGVKNETLGDTELPVHIFKRIA
ncbi:baseplate wedge subunit [Proteus phage phiP4-3]|uniref:Baseplate wedge subunit and tail pin n=1 Tax=Proteus phage phiP4-3 TaxID=2065203 RepID=A0A2I6PFG9_9CAUD|nr:baseplate wedge subunit [Proteus phage phiP4-3]AUM58475.1 baseplate wedge subunit and tail pin [Proteus phage phiP4-3]AZV01281.1 baseplate wedge subunit and tail pin [Shigella phage vB_SdyM_006]